MRSFPKTEIESGIACICDRSDWGINGRPNAKRSIKREILRYKSSEIEIFPKKKYQRDRDLWDLFQESRTNRGLRVAAIGSTGACAHDYGLETITNKRIHSESIHVFCKGRNQTNRRCLLSPIGYCEYGTRSLRFGRCVLRRHWEYSSLLYWLKHRHYFNFEAKTRFNKKEETIICRLTNLPEASGGKGDRTVVVDRKLENCWRIC